MPQTDNQYYPHYFKRLAESIQQIFLVIDTTTLAIEYINKFQPGYTEENVYGKNVLDFVALEYVEEYKNKIQHVIDKKISQQLTVIGTSTKYENGKAWYKTDLIPYFDNTNEVIKIFIISDEITELILKEKTISDSSDKIKAIINNTTDIICSINTNFELIEFNKIFAEIVHMGYQKYPQVGDKVLDYIDPRRHEKLTGIYNSVLQGELITDVEIFGTPSNTELYFETRYHPISTNQGSISGITIYSKDITSQVEQKNDLKKALAEKEILLSEIHHRIKNNLALVSGMLELQTMKLSDNEVIEILNTSRYRIKTTALVHELLYSNDTFNQLEIQHYLNQLIKLLSKETEHGFIVSGDDAILNFKTAMPLGLMLNEFLMNSIKHSNNTKNAITRIEIKRIIDGLEINYKDEAGFFPEEIDFYTADSTGLTLIRTFAEQLNGEIKLVQKKSPHFKITIKTNG